MKGPGPLGGGGSSLKDAHYYKQTGTNPLELWYYGSAANTVGTATSFLAVDTYYATGIIFPRGGVLDRIAIDVTGAGGEGTVAALGIYTATSVSNLVPLVRVVDAGTVSVAVGGVRSANINYTVAPNVLYWLAVCTPDMDWSLRYISKESVWPWWGYDVQFTNGSGCWYAADAYVTPMPVQFPSPGACLPGDCPLIAVRMSA